MHDSPTPRPIEPVLELLRVQEAAWNRGDLEAFVGSGYLETENLNFLSGGTWTRGFDGLLERYRKNYQEGDAEMGQLSFTELETVALGQDHALARGRWQLEYTDGRTPGGLFSLILWKTSDGWRIVHDHTSSKD